ncbi:MAG: GvpL/GvpF family gas vesicle protein [Acidobacteria bacterium]|nr:GvpL/GvpF family gas vesicle protein [Acidobacteriota bacterium]
MIYVYAITEEAPWDQCGGSAPDGWPPAVDANHKVILIPLGQQLAAVASQADPESWSDDPAALAAAAYAHHEVVSAAHHRAPVVPFRFGTVFSTREELILRLAAQASTWLDSLQLVAGCAEWDLCVEVDQSRLRESLSGGLNASASALSPGRRYLLERTLDRELPALAAERSRAVWTRLLTKTQPIARSSVELSSGHRAFLIPQTMTKVFSLLVEEINELEVGLRVTVCGVWPPYSFVGRSLPLKAQHAQAKTEEYPTNPPRAAMQSEAVGAS